MLPPDLHTQFPFESRFLDVGGARLHYVDEGHGPPVVMVHGNPTWSFYFRHLIAGLRDAHRVIALDHIGCGLSDKPQRYPYTLRQHIANLGRLLDHLALSPVSLVMHDWGGAIAMGWAVQHADRVNRLVVGNSAAFIGPVPFRIRFCRWPIVGEVGVRGLNMFARIAIHMASRVAGTMTKPVRRGYLWPYRSYADRVGILGFIRDIPLRTDMDSHRMFGELQDGLCKLTEKPMLLVWGGKDFCFHDGFLREWIRRFPQAQAHRFAAAGHYIFEDAAVQITPLVQSFLSRD